MRYYCLQKNLCPELKLTLIDIMGYKSRRFIENDSQNLYNPDSSITVSII